MSRLNYRRCVAMGVTGPNTNTCFPASNDQLLAQQNISPEFYSEYGQFWDKYIELPHRQRNPSIKRLYDGLARVLGLDSSADIAFENITSMRGLKRALRHYSERGYVCTTDIEIPAELRQFAEDTHSVGIYPLESDYEYLKLYSTHVPRYPGEVVHVEDLFDALNHPNLEARVRYPFNDANFTAIPKL